MSNIFSKLLDESDKQHRQLQAAREHKIVHVIHSTSVSKSEETDLPTERRSDPTTMRPSDGATVVHNDPPTQRPTDEATERRMTDRIAFDLYVDQIKAIRRLRAERELDGNARVGLSDIAREAFDLYFKEKTKQ